VPFNTRLWTCPVLTPLPITFLDLPIYKAPITSTGSGKIDARTITLGLTRFSSLPPQSPLRILGL